MFVAIPNSVCYRFYGDNLFLFDKKHWASALVRDIDIFRPIFSYHPVCVEKVASEIADARKVNITKVLADIHDLIDPLIADGYCICGERVAVADIYSQQIASQPYGSDGHQDVSASKDNGEEAILPLMDYFLCHPTPFELCIDLTRACTERCVHCYVPEFQNVFLPYELVEKVLAEFHVMGGLKVKLTGGECMLHPDFERVVALARTHDMVISVLSNLTCCDVNKVRVMKDADVVVVQVSLYGMTIETHETVTRTNGSLAKTLRGIELLREAGVPVQIHCPVLKQNVAGIDAVADYGRKMGSKTTFDAVMMSRADHGCNMGCGLSDGELRNYIESHEDLPVEMPICTDVDPNGHACEIGTSKICLSAEGKYYPCNGCYGYELGDCRSQTLNEVWNAEPIKRLRALRMRDFPACGKCPNRMFCSPCPSRNFNANGDLTTPDPAVCRAASVRKCIVECRRKEQ